MTEKITKLLTALQETARSENTNILTAEQVNQMGAKLGATRENVIRWIAECQNEEFISLEWGGKLEIMNNTQNTNGINFTGATINAPVAIGVNNTAGDHSIGAGAINTTEPQASTPPKPKNIIARITDWMASIGTIADNIPKLIFLVGLIIGTATAIVKYFGP